MVEYVLPYVVRVEKGYVVTAEDAYIAAAAATVKFLDQNRNSSEFKTWAAADYRKVVRRARGVKWDKAKDNAEIVASHDDVEVAIFAFHDLATESPDYLRSLQVSGLELPSGIVGGSSTKGALCIAQAYQKMSSGKAIAQASHAAQMAYLANPAAALKSVKEGTLSVLDIKDAPSDAFVVKDNGLTEIPAGTVTFKAWFQK